MLVRDVGKPAGLKPLKGGREALFFAGVGAGKPVHLGIEAWDGTLYVATFPMEGGTNHAGPGVRPPAALGVSWVLWTVVGTFFALVIAPAGLWLIRLR